MIGVNDKMGKKEMESGMNCLKDRSVCGLCGGKRRVQIIEKSAMFFSFVVMCGATRE